MQETVDLPSGFTSLQLTFGLWRAIHVTVGDQSLAYHTSNLLFHVLNAALFYFVARRFLAVSHSSNLNETDRTLLGFWGAMIFACHRLCTEPINYAAQTSILMVSFFGMLATLLFWCWHETRRLLYLTLVPLALLIAAHSKEPGHVPCWTPFVLPCSPDVFSQPNGEMEAELMASHVRDCRCWNGSHNLCRILYDGRGEARL